MTRYVFMLAMVLCGAHAAAQSPRDLLSAPDDGVRYYETKQRAAALVESKSAAEAEPLVEQLVRDYPRDGSNWVLLANTKLQLKKYAEAARAYEKAGSILGGQRLRFRAAANYLAAGDKKKSIALIRELMKVHKSAAIDFYEAEEFASIKNDPEFLKAIGRPRNGSWRQDLAYLKSEIERVNPDPLPPEFARRYERLKRDIPKLSDEEIVVRMNQMLHVLHEGHTDFSFLNSKSKPKFSWLPIRVYLFPEGVFIINASEQYKELIGSRIVAFGKTAADEAWRLVSETRSADGDMEYVWQVPANLLTPAFLQGLHIIDSPDRVELTIETPAGARKTITLPATTSVESYPPPPGVVAPISIGRDDEKHWNRFVPEHDAMYVRFSGVGNDKDETLAAFGKRLWKELGQQTPHNLILDMRLNRGGNSALYPELLRTAIAFSLVEGNRVYALIGRSTYSAAANFITELERLADPIFVGEASSQCCHFHGDPIYVSLPYSKVEGVLTAWSWNLSTPWDERREISPAVPVQLTAKDYFGGRDPALEAVYRLIESRRHSQ